MFVLLWTTLLLAVKAQDASTDEITATTAVQEIDLWSQTSPDTDQYSDAEDLQTDLDQDPVKPRSSDGTVPGKNLTEGHIPPESSSPTKTEVLTIPKPTTPVIPHVTTQPTTENIFPTEQPNTILTSKPTILPKSSCTNPPGILSCVCISEGSPLPVIDWPLLKHHSNYSVTTTVSNHQVNSSIVLSVKDQSNTRVQCISKNDKGHATEDLLVTKAAPEDGLTAWVGIMTKLEIIISFTTGAVLAAVICCSVINCCRRKRQTYKNMETLEMGTCGRDKLMNAGSAVTSGGGRAAMAERQDVEYSSLDFSRTKRGPSSSRDKERDTKTLYAEIKKVKRAGR